MGVSQGDMGSRVRDSGGNAGYVCHRRSATMQIRRNYMSPGLVAASGGAAPTSATVGRSGSAVPESLRAVGVPVYTHTEVLLGSAIMLALCLVVLVALVVGWWRLR